MLRIFLNFCIFRTIGDGTSLGKPARVAAQKTLPFELLVPNSETIDAIKAARRGELVMVGGLRNLLQQAE
jgi:RelB antitoxin